MIETITVFKESYPYIVAALAFVLGAIVGSFLNVCIYRLPKAEGIVTPRSKCPKCGEFIRWYDNIPVLGWFLLLGKCRFCKKPISFRYVVVEFFTGFLFVLCWMLLSVDQAIVGMVFIGLLTVASFIDLDEMYIPDKVTVYGFFAVLFLVALFPDVHSLKGHYYTVVAKSLSSLSISLIGVIVGTGILVWIAIIGEIFLKRECMGYGDFKLMGLIGACCGWNGAIFSIFGGAMVATLILLPIFLIKGSKLKGLEVPFGPFLSIAAIIYYIFLKNGVYHQILEIVNHFVY